MEEAKVYEALGLTPPEMPAEGGNEREPADPAPQQEPPVQDEGANEREPADPAPETDPTEPAPDGDVDGPEGPAAPTETGKKPSMTVQQRREAAAQRRRQERQADIDEAVSKALQAERAKTRTELEGFFQSAGLKNTMTGEPITTMEEFAQWQQAYRGAQMERALKAGKLTPEALNQAITDHPAVRRMNELAEREEAQLRRREEEAAAARVQEDLAEIQKLDPSIHTVEDLLHMPTAKEFCGYVKGHGLSFLDAFRLANGSKLAQRTAEVARQQARVNSRGKDHMTTTRPQGQGAESVPAEEMRIFKILNPSATDQQIQDYYNKVKKRGG